MPHRTVVARGVVVALLVGCVLSAVAFAASRPTGAGRPAAVATPVSHEKVQAAIASGRLLFVGASYTVGLGATKPTAGYAPVLAGDLDRRYTVAAVSGTGFCNPGAHHQGTFGQRIAALPATLDPRIVVIQGGRNDAAYPLTTVQTTARSTITLARTKFRHAQVVVMGPIPATVPVSPRLLQLRDAVRSAARQTGAGFIDPLAQGWITEANEKQFAGPVPAHPNDAGYRYIAARLRADLPAALDTARPPLAAQDDQTPTVGIPGNGQVVAATPAPGSDRPVGDSTTVPAANAGADPNDHHGD